MNDDKTNHINLKILKEISKEQSISQRLLSEKIGISLGKLNNCIKKLQEDNFIKYEDPKNENKFIYILTSTGKQKKEELALKLINKKIEEYDELIKDEKINVSKKNISKTNKINFGIGHNSVKEKELVTENKTRTKPLFKTIAVNLKRRTVIVDDILTTHKGMPIPSWIELSIIDVCNRSCSFCPKSDPKIAPDTYQRMQMNLIDKLTDELKEINYKGSVVLCGYGEPMLHKDVNIISKKLSEVSFVEVVTNGDTLKPKKIKDLYMNNVNKLLISMYDGEHQRKNFQDMIEESKVPKDFVILRDRWYDEKKDYGLKLTNRTGTIKIGDQEKIGKYKKCFYPSYQLLIDWNGDVFLCPQDWQRRVAMGNMMQEHIFDIWTNKIMSKYRKNLINGKRTDSPCTLCNAEGTVLGKNHANAWAHIYREKKSLNL